MLDFVPEPDGVKEPEHFFKVIDPKEFLEEGETLPPKPKGRKPSKVCRRGHTYALFGVIRKDGKRRCRKCASIREQERKKRTRRKKK